MWDMQDTLKLTDEQLQAVATNSDEPVRLAGPDADYVLVRADVYEKLRAVVDGVTRRAGWDDPELDEYERYRKAQ